MTTATATTGAQLTSEPGPALAAIRDGDAVIAEDGVLGRVERLVRSEARTPAYLVVRAGRTLRRRYPVVPVSLVTRVDSRRRLVRVRGRCKSIAHLPETLPLVLWAARPVHSLTDLVGYRVLGRQGELGRVVDLEGLEAAPEGSTLVVRGGVSDALVYHVPAMHLVGVSHDTGTVSADVDVADFVPSFGDGGTVELRLASWPPAREAQGDCDIVSCGAGRASIPRWLPPVSCSRLSSCPASDPAIPAVLGVAAASVSPPVQLTPFAQDVSGVSTRPDLRSL